MRLVFASTKDVGAKPCPSSDHLPVFGTGINGLKKNKV